MTYAPSLEEFLTQPQPDEEETSPEIAGSGGALDSIARSMEALVDLQKSHQTRDQADERLVRDLESLDAECRTLRSQRDALGRQGAELAAQLEQVKSLIKPSTSKLANSIRAVLEPPAVVGETTSDEPGAEGEPCPVHGWAHKFKTCEQVTAEQSAAPAEPPSVPAHDADVWEWRAYAIRLGRDNVEVGGMNRSQIRTMLGIEQPVGA